MKNVGYYLYFFLEKILTIPQRLQTHLFLFKCYKIINNEVTTCHIAPQLLSVNVNKTIIEELIW